MTHKQIAKKTHQAVRRGIADEWRLIFKLPLIRRIKLAGRIVRGR